MTVEKGPATPEVRPVVRQRLAQRKRRRRRTMAVQVAFTVIALVVAVALVWTGWRSTLRITGGRNELVTDPAAPGYVAEVRSTPVSLVAVTGDAGELITLLMVISDPGTKAATAVPISPLLTLWEFEGSPPANARTIFQDGRIDVLRLRLGAELGFGATDTMVVPGSALVRLAARSGAVTLSLPDDVFEGAADSQPEDTTIRYPAGELQLEPDQVDDFLAFDGYREPEPNRALRSGELWSALLDRADGVTAEDLGGSDLQGFVELLELLGADDTTVQIAPTSQVVVPVVPPLTLYRIDADAMKDWAARHVPFPTAAYPGQRATVAVLDGTGQDGAIRSVAPRIVDADGEIALTGNAEGFDLATSRVEYQRPEAKSAAEDIASALGVPAARADDARSDVDVTVVVGKDLLT